MPELERARGREQAAYLSSRVLAVAAIASLALGASIYMVYLLEIVKLANPRIRRREARVREHERRSA